MDKDWILVFVLETGESAVAAKDGRVQLFTYDRVKEVIADFRPGQISYFPEGGYTLTETIDEEIAQRHPPIAAIGVQGVPRSDYDPKEHDVFHLRLGPRLHDLIDEGKQAMERLGLAGNLEYPGSALDVMTNLERLTKYAPIIDHPKYTEQMRELLAEAHPILWAPNMTRMAREAVVQLQESLPVENDLLFLDPVIWLYTEPQWDNANPAEKCEYPLTADGHIPFPDEPALDVGAFSVAYLFYLDEDGIGLWLFSLVMREGEWLLEGGWLKLPMRTVPSDQGSQNLLKWLRFASSPYLIVKRYQPQRTVIRRAAGRYPIAAEGIGVILLRRASYQFESKRKGEGEPVEWSCQWWVSGHWRRQWYPSSQKHKPVWIAPYIKGPPDRPLKETIRLMVR